VCTLLSAARLSLEARDGTVDVSGDIKIIAKNRRARHEYHVVDSVEVGVVLRGTEVKSARLGKVQLVDSFAKIENEELFLYGTHISPYEYGNRSNVDPTRTRKLLAHKTEILRLNRQVQEKGMTLIPLTVYLKGGRVKVEIGLCRGKRMYDKRESIEKREAAREMERAMKRRTRGSES
jgi:SsrA-binding protein